MSRLKTLMWCAASAAAAIALVLACSDDDVSLIDAARGADAQCDCPAPAERIDGRLRFSTVQGQIPDDANDFNLGISCTPAFGVGSRPIGGGCAQLTANVSTFLQTSVGDEVNWGCTWRHPPGTGVITVEARVLCLVPEGTPDAGP